MATEKEIILKVDPQMKIGVNDVIDMLKGLRNETIYEIIKSSSVKNEENKNINSVTGNTSLPQIRELNEIAALLRSMENKQS